MQPNFLDSLDSESLNSTEILMAVFDLCCLAHQNGTAPPSLCRDIMQTTYEALKFFEQGMAGFAIGKHGQTLIRNGMPDGLAFTEALSFFLKKHSRKEARVLFERAALLVNSIETDLPCPHSTN